MITNKLTFNQWTAELIGKELHISNSNFPDSDRIYDIKQKNDGIEYDKAFPEYFTIKTKDFDYQFKFEENDCFIGDKFKEGEIIDTVACVEFGEETF